MISQKKSIKIAMIGATGRVGSLLSQAFQLVDLCNGSLFPLARNPATSPINMSFAWDITAGPAAFLQASRKVGGFDTVFDFSGVTPGPHAGPMALNSTLALAVYDAAVDAGAGHVFTASSAAVYGATETAKPLSELDECHPVSDYGRAKFAMEKALLTCAEPDTTGVTCLRIGNVAGADQLLLRSVGRPSGQPLFLDQFADGKYPLRSYIGTVTLAKVLFGLAQQVTSGTRIPQILNVAAPEPVYMDALLDAVPDWAKPVNWRSSAAPAAAIPAVVLDTTKLEQLYRFAPADSTATEMVSQWLATRGPA